MLDPTSDTPLPRIDLHRQLTGSTRLETILELAEAHDLPLPRTLEALRPLAQVTAPLSDLPSFLDRRAAINTFLLDLGEEALGLARRLVEDAV